MWTDDIAHVMPVSCCTYGMFANIDSSKQLLSFMKRWEAESLPRQRLEKI